MTTAAELRAEARQLRAFSRIVTDPAALAEVQAMIEVLERRARSKDNGGASDG